MQDPTDPVLYELLSNKQENNNNQKSNQKILHPLYNNNIAFKDSYFLGLLLILIENNEDLNNLNLIKIAESIGISNNHLDELKNTALLYDSIGREEYFSKLNQILSFVLSIYCFLCDYIIIHKDFAECEYDTLKTMWYHISIDILGIATDDVFILWKFCEQMLKYRISVPTKSFENIPDSVINFYLPNISLQKDYLVINLSEGYKASQYSIQFVDTPPDLTSDKCRTKELWLRLIHAGTFTMGAPKDEIGNISCDESHQVILTNDFYIGIFPITQYQWNLVMGENPSYFKSNRCAPVESISYDMICGVNRRWPADYSVAHDSFLDTLNRKTRLNCLDLPSEAEWEYACRAGYNTALNNGNNLSSVKEECQNLNELGWYKTNSNHHTHTVGTKLPNAWGLYDMHGNVFEWCRDWYIDYTSECVTDPIGNINGIYRVIRGGSWSSFASDCRSAYRYGEWPDSMDSHIGFRLAFVSNVYDNLKI